MSRLVKSLYKHPIEASSLSDDLMSLIGDYDIMPVVEGITEKFIIKSIWAHAFTKYCIYAGDTPMTDTPVPVTEETVTAKEGFEGSNVSIRFYDNNGSEMFRAALSTLVIGDRKVGKFKIPNYT